MASVGTQGLQAEDPHERGLLFKHVDGTPLSRYQFSKVFLRALVSLNLTLRSFGLLSFRIGAASTAAALGSPLLPFRARGDGALVHLSFM